ncbi:hypothetical protein D3C87_1562440 [compost metagenome]
MIWIFLNHVFIKLSRFGECTFFVKCARQSTLRMQPLIPKLSRFFKVGNSIIQSLIPFEQLTLEFIKNRQKRKPISTIESRFQYAARLVESTRSQKFYDFTNLTVRTDHIQCASPLSHLRNRFYVLSILLRKRPKLFVDHTKKSAHF